MNVRRLFTGALRRGLGPLVPAGRRLAFDAWLATLDGIEPELKHLARLGPNRGTAIDVGANHGLYAHALSRLYQRVVAFEINDGLTATLRAYARGRAIDVHGVGLSSEPGDRTLYVPVQNGRPQWGWASLSPGNLPTAAEHLERPVQVRTLDSFGLTDVTFLKADVEGHELQLLAGARDTLRRNRPVVLLEVREANRPQVAAYFAELGYEEKRLNELIGVAGSAENYVYVPTGGPGGAG